jgi:hypothetical protein
MRRGSIFWGVLLVILGILFILQTSGLISDVFGWFWPVFLILLGVWVLTARMMPQALRNQQDFSVDLQGATQLALDFDHGAGSVQLGGGVPNGVAISGTQATGMEVKSHRMGDRLDVEIDAGPSLIPFLGPDGGVWRFLVNQQVPLTLDVDAGASSLDFDLSDLKVTHMKVDMGASILKVKLPTGAGNTRLDIDAGAANINLSVPQGVAARLRLDQGASSLDVDMSRFPMQSSGFYQSADYETAVNKVEINLSGGANTVKVW